MTLNELSQLYYLKREIKKDERRLKELEALSEPGAQRITGMPHSGNVADNVSMYGAEIADLHQIIEAKQQLCLLERARLERYIAGIEDSRIRLIFTSRFVDCKTWERVADDVGGGNTGDGVKVACYRFLKNS